MTSPAAVDEASAWRVLAVRDLETGADHATTWTAADRAWATRLAQQTSGSAAAAAPFLAVRARHVLERLRSRGAIVVADVPPQRPLVRWAAAAALLGLLAGVLVDRIGPSQRIDLLAPPVWLVLAWNLAVYVALPFARWPLAPPWRRQLLALWAPVTTQPKTGLSWTEIVRPAQAARLAAVLHVAAAALAAGVIAGMYLRGLVLDYRAGWQSTFLDAGTVHAWLQVLLQPAAQITGIALPDPAALAALRIGAGGAAQGDAAPWIHLYATTLALAVIVPRTLLAARAAALARWRSRRIALPLGEPYFERLLRSRSGTAARVCVQACGWTPPPEALAGLRALLAPELGDAIELSRLEIAGGDDEPGEGEPAAIASDAAPPALAVMLFNLASTPEPEVHGEALVRLRSRVAPAPVKAVADESGYAARMAAYPQRIDERRRLWRDFASVAGVELVFAALPEAAR